MALFEDERKLRVTIMMNREQRDDLDELAKFFDTSRSSVARFALDRGVGDLQDEMKKKAATAK